MLIRPLTFAVSILFAGACYGEMITVRYRGVVNEVGVRVPEPFEINQVVWGEYTFDADSNRVLLGPNTLQYPAIRQLTVRSEDGFFASNNFGTISLEKGFRRDSYVVTSRPPILLIPADDEGGWWPDGFDPDEPGGAGSGGDFPDVVHITYALDHAAKAQAVEKSRALGMLEPSGAFSKYERFNFILSLSGLGLLLNQELNYSLPSPSATPYSSGSLDFGEWMAEDSRYLVRFDITELTLVPEPNAAVLLIGILFLISQRADAGQSRLHRCSTTRAPASTAPARPRR